MIWINVLDIYVINRPRMVMLNELVGAGWNLAIMPYGDHFKGMFRNDAPKNLTDYWYSCEKSLAQTS